jgi:hypothetical protein
MNELPMFAFFDISFYSFNLLSVILGMFFGATMWRVKAMFFVAFYFIGVAIYYGILYYMKSKGVI